MFYPDYLNAETESEQAELAQLRQKMEPLVEIMRVRVTPSAGTASSRSLVALTNFVTLRNCGHLKNPLWTANCKPGLVVCN